TRTSTRATTSGRDRRPAHGRIGRTGAAEWGRSMAGYTTFTLYWEQWGGYPDRPYPFGNPTLTWVVASPEHAACCAGTSTSRGSTGGSWGAKWRPVARRRIDPLPALLDDVGAF